MNVVFTWGFSLSSWLFGWLVVRTDMDAEDADFKNLFVWQLTIVLYEGRNIPKLDGTFGTSPSDP